MKFIKPLVLLLVFSVVLASCDKDDYTGYSRLKPTSPEITITAPDDAALGDIDEYLFDIEIDMDVAQIVDVAVYFVQIGGDAVYHEDYTIYWNDPATGARVESDRLIIPKGVTHITATLEILSLELNDGDLFLDLQVGDDRTANADITPVSFTIDRTP